MKYLKSFELFESKDNPLTIGEELISLLDDYQIKEFFLEHYIYSPDKNEMLEQMPDLWKYVNDEKFISDWIGGEVESYTYDWAHYFDSQYDRTKLLIPYIIEVSDDDNIEYIRNKYAEEYLDKNDEDFEDQKNIDFEEILEYFDNNELKDIIEHIIDISHFCEWYLVKQYEHSTAKQILNSTYSDDELECNAFFMKDTHNIQKYLDNDQMIKDYNKYFVDDEWMFGTLSDKVHNNKKLQKLIFDTNPEKSCLLLVNSGYLTPELGVIYEFQKNYLEESIKEYEKEETFEDELDKTTFIWTKLKDYFIDEDIAINEKIVKEYKLEDLIEQEQSGYFNLKH